MRALLLALSFSILTFFPNAYAAGNTHQIAAATDTGKSNPNGETYRDYHFDLTAIDERQDYMAIEDAVRHQIDIVEHVGLSPRVLKIFRRIPILVDELECLGANGTPDTNTKMTKPTFAAACYEPLAPGDLPGEAGGVSVWSIEKWQWVRPNGTPVDMAEQVNLGVVKIRPSLLDPERPILLHELLHAYHAQIIPQGFRAPAILYYYDLAKKEPLYPIDAYLMTNEREFFAVTASVFLYGKADQEPFTRSNLKQKQPEYYSYLVWLFGFDPNRAPNASPLASAH